MTDRDAETPREPPAASSAGDAATSEARREPQATSSPGDAGTSEASPDPQATSSAGDAGTSEAPPDPQATSSPEAPVETPPAPPPIDPTSPTAILETLGRALPPDTLDELWIFPPRRIGPGQSTIVVASVLDPDPESDRRRIFTARFTLARDRKGKAELAQEMVEEGAAPAELVARVVDGVVRRLDDEPAPPRHARIQGKAEVWAELLAALRE